MEDEAVSSSKITPVVTLSDDALDLESPSRGILRCYAEKRDLLYREESTRDALDLENVSTSCTDTSDDEEEEETPERLSADIEELASRLVTDAESSVDCKREPAYSITLLPSVLQERTQQLRLEMTDLREELNRETALWRKEKEEFQFLREQSDAFAFEEAAAAARAAAAAYAIESPLSSDLSKTVDVTSEQSVRELAILEYEKNLAKYQDPCSLEQAERRYNAYKRALVDAYKQKLLEVERLCNEELEKIRESASYLQSFKEIASQWSVSEKDRGDSSRHDQADGEQSKIAEANFEQNNWRPRLARVDNEVNMSPEIFSAWLKREDAT
ncbi:PREDICTED: uncharacterized protein LOC106748146 [Dinoponera quadriceps]|uniref:Uncharacterized protein LOC106748146 n=1 Tax=Dinoponera quadriceps TaxID=609295 RepID=A0A6P3XUQ6_DINQU|nr:PREDICTED: uncharacterized protein LOC106748146 [Dinoponera quadriceps]